MTSSMPPPGWYPNPSGEPGQRYWDGHNWTIENVPPKPPPGWYTNPSGEPGQRYWDGHQWTSVDSPAEGPTRKGSSTDVDSAAEDPAPVGPSNRGFLERHRTAIVIGAVFVLGGGCAAGIAAME